MSGSTDDSNNIESSMNTVFIPELGHKEFMLQQPPELGSPDVVSLREGLGTSDGPTIESIFDMSLVYLSLHKLTLVHRSMSFMPVYVTKICFDFVISNFCLVTSKMRYF